MRESLHWSHQCVEWLFQCEKRSMTDIQACTEVMSSCSDVCISATCVGFVWHTSSISTLVHPNVRRQSCTMSFFTLASVTNVRNGCANVRNHRLLTSRLLQRSKFDMCTCQTHCYLCLREGLRWLIWSVCCSINEVIALYKDLSTILRPHLTIIVTYLFHKLITRVGMLSKILGWWHEASTLFDVWALRCDHSLSHLWCTAHHAHACWTHRSPAT